MGNEAFDVFVSYARADWRHAADIVAGLQARGLTFFFDRRDLPPGLPSVRELEKALNAAKAAIILIGPHGLGNTQQYERDLALYRQTRDPSFPIVPVILPEAQIDRPFNFLQILTWIDFSQVSKVSDAPAELERLVAAVRGGEILSADSVRETICPYGASTLSARRTRCSSNSSDYYEHQARESERSGPLLHRQNEQPGHRVKCANSGGQKRGNGAQASGDAKEPMSKACYHLGGSKKNHQNSDNSLGSKMRRTAIPTIRTSTGRADTSLMEFQPWRRQEQ
jgi:hypothetical protein